jgi:DNA-binding transcriptional ArsR family regulator
MLSTLPPRSLPDSRLDRVFGALAHSARRTMLARLAQGPLLVTELAAPFSISLPAVSKHLRVLEGAGLIARDIDGRAHRCSLRLDTVTAAEQWLASRRAFWEGTLDALARHVAKDKRARKA